jgi:subtilisin-like proprotein convertase family protein
MKNWLLFLFIVFTSVQAFAGEYYFYYQGKKIFMNRNDSYIAVKFSPDVSLTKSQRIIEDYAGSWAGKKFEFSPGSSRSRYMIIKFKGNVNENSFSAIKKKLIDAAGVESVGMCFPGRGKMRHYTTNEIIVKFKKYVSQSEIENTNRFYGTSIIEKVDNSDNVYLLSVTSRGEEGSDNVFDVSNKYVLLDNIVEFAQPNFIREGMLLSEDNAMTPPPMPNDPLVTQMWHVKNTGNNIPDNVQGIPGCDMNLDSAWAITTGNPNVLIAITDTGVDTNHVDLRNNLCDRSLWYDAVDNNQRPYDQYYHGTGVTGCTSAIGNNDTGTVGVAYTCKCMPIRVFGPYPYGFTTDLILAKGLNWAWMHGASVINCSWGGGVPTPLISDAIQNSVHLGRSGRGALVFAGSGNDNVDSILYPASMPEVIAVGGLSPCNERKNPHSCDFNLLDSNQFWGASYGAGLSIVAPCTFIGTTELSPPPNPPYYWCICGNGTSCSSPLAAGVGALIFSKNGNLSGDSARMIIEKTARKVGNYSYNVLLPNGRWDYEMGYGRIDAKDALDMTPSGPPTGSDIIPPAITIYPPESGVFNGNVSVNAVISDNTGVSAGVNMPRLYYHTIQNSQMQVIFGTFTSANNYKFTFPRIPSSMSLYYYIAAQDNYSNVTTYPLGGRGSNPPGSVKPPKMMFLRNTPTYDTNFAATNVPIQIVAPRPATFYSVFHNPVNKTVLDVDCWFNITHNFDSDLSLTLISPGGTEITISGGVGDSSRNFINTYLDDEAPVPIDDSSVHAPFTGHFKPVQKLWFFDGENSGGDWTLKILDNSFGDVGALTSWGMKITYSSGPDYVQIPDRFALVRNYPNPFNPQTRIVFNVPFAANIKIVLYDLTGRLVKTILNERRGPALEDFVDFNISSVNGGNGNGIASGVYFYSLIADDKFIESKKMVLLK